MAFLCEKHIKLPHKYLLYCRAVFEILVESSDVLIWVENVLQNLSKFSRLKMFSLCLNCSLDCIYQQLIVYTY